MKGVLKRSAVWYIRYTVNGKRKWEAIGPSKRQAELVLSRRRTEIVEGRYFPIAKGRKTAYGQLLDRYLEYAKTAKKKGSYRTDLSSARHLRGTFGALPLQQVTPGPVVEYLERKLAGGLAPSTCQNHLSLIKHSFTMAVKWELLPHNPLRGVRLPVRINNARKRYLLPDEMQRLLHALPLHWKPVVLAALHTGLRKTNLFHLRWEQIDFTQGVITVPTTKNDDPLLVYLDQPTKQRLQDIREEQQGTGSPWVFPNPRTGRPYAIQQNDLWQKTLKRASITDFRFHDLRHTFASYLRMAGVDLLTIKEALGHRSLRATERYAHINST